MPSRVRSSGRRRTLGSGWIATHEYADVDMRVGLTHDMIGGLWIYGSSEYMRHT